MAWSTMAGGYYRKILNLISAMALSTSELKKRLQKPVNSETIRKASDHQNRVKFHVETRLSDNSAEAGNFFGWVDSLIPKDKAAIFKSLFRYPVKTNEVTEIAFDRLSRVFEGRNPSFVYQFKKTESADDWEWYRQEILNEPNIWQSTGWSNFKTEINSILVVDLSKEQETDRPAPYFYWLPIDSVIDYDISTAGNIELLIFKQGEKIAVIDSERYRLFESENDNIGTELVNNAHNLGYCPARFFWDQSLSLSTPELKASPISRQLSALDWYLFYSTSKKHLDLYGSYPIYSGYQQICEFKDETSDDYCDGGFIRSASGNWKYGLNGSLMRCPKCGDKRLSGAGSFIEVPAPSSKEDPDLRRPVDIITIDRSSLDYNVEEEKRLKENIITAIVGGDDLNPVEAINEKQVAATFENKNSVLNRIKKGFEAAQEFVDSTVCRLRYGDEFISLSVNYGTDFFTETADNIRTRYAAAKEAGASMSELDNLARQILEAENVNNPQQLQRMLILMDIEPLRHFTINEAINLHDKGLISLSDLLIKLNFSTFVSRFERENINILEFGSLVPYVEKITTIYNKLKDYASITANT